MAYCMYEIEAAPGDYEIYAVHTDGDVWRVSNRTKVTITPSYSVRDVCSADAGGRHA